MAQRPWIRLWTHKLRDSRKFGRMTLEQRGVWMSLLVLAGTHEPEAEWESVDDLTWGLQLILRTEDEEAARWVQWMIAAGLLDLREGRVLVHDWTEHQPVYRGPSDDPDAAAERMRKARQNASPPEPFEPVRARSTRSIDTDTERDTESESPPPPPPNVLEIDPGDPVDAYYAVTLRYPNSRNLRDWIERIGREHPVPRFRAALEAEHRADPSPRDLLSRVEVRLNREADKARRGRLDPAPKMIERPRPARVTWRGGDGTGDDEMVPGGETPGGVDRGRGAPSRVGGVGLSAVLGSAGRLGGSPVNGGAVRGPDRGGSPEGGEDLPAGGSQPGMDRAVH